jgi:hypothetical protein
MSSDETVLGTMLVEALIRLSVRSEEPVRIGSLHFGI